MRMGKKRLTEKAYTNGTLEQVERERERKNGCCFSFGEEDE
jgi:hypothetical protein